MKITEREEQVLTHLCRLSPSDIWTEESVLPDLAVKNSKQKQDQNKMSPNAGNTTKIL